jgi:hypothetical protein
MLNFNFQIQNTAVKEVFQIIYCKSGKILGGELFAWEAQINYEGLSRILDASVGLKYIGDHPGLYCEFGLLGYSFMFSIYDTNHYDDDSSDEE